MDIKCICREHKQLEIKKGSLPEVSEKILSNFYKQIKNSKQINQYLTDIPKGPGTFCPDSPVKELAEYIGMQSSNIDKSDPDVNLSFLRNIVMPAVQTEQNQALRVIVLEDKTDATLLERLLIKKGVNLARAIDRLWIKWFEKVVRPWQKLDEISRKKYKKTFQNDLNHFDYTVFGIKENRIIDRQTWIEAFPQEIEIIVDILKELSSDKLVQEDLILCKYIESLCLAYQCNEIDKLEECWANVDRRWIEISPDCRVFFVHGIENGYEHPVCVSPEFRLVVRTQEIRETIERFRKATAMHIRHLGIEEKEIQILSNKLGKIDISVFVALIRGGVSANFRGSGQVAPNREDIMEIGGKIFLDNKSGSKVSADIYKKELKDNCLISVNEKLRDLITPEVMTLHTIIHEYFHPVGRTIERTHALGDAGLSLEEGKATLGGILVAQKEGIDQIELLALTVARVCRFMHKEKINNLSVASYVRENMIAATTMLDSGVMVLEGNGIAIELEKLPAWFEEIEDFIKKILDAYQKASVEKIIEIEKEYCNIEEGSAIAELINWVNRDKCGSVLGKQNVYSSP